MRKLGDTDVLNKTIALRVDLNVPVKDGKVLDETRPYLINDGGNVSIVRVDEEARSVYLKLEGACGNCASSTVTMSMGITRVLKENFDNLGEVVQVEDEDDDSNGEYSSSFVFDEDDDIRYKFPAP